jgi:hypothetical protein
MTSLYQKHMVSVWKNWLKNWLITASLAVAGGMVFGMAAFTGFRLSGRQIALQAASAAVSWP